MGKRAYMVCYPCIGKQARGRATKPAVWFIGNERCSLCKKAGPVVRGIDVGVYEEGQFGGIMKKALTLLLVLAVNVMADYEDYRNTSIPRQEYAAPSKMDRQMSSMNMRLQFIQPMKIQTVAAPRIYAPAPIMPMPVAKPPSFLSFLGKAIAQIPSQIGRAIMTAIKAPVQWVQNIVRGPQKVAVIAPTTPLKAMVNQRTVAVTAIKPQNVFSPAPAKPQVIVTPIAEIQPKHNITTPTNIKTPQNVHVVDNLPKQHAVTKGPGLVDKMRQLIGIPRHVPIGKLYPEPGNDYTKRPGNDAATVELKVKEIRNGRFEPISVIKTPQGYMITNGHHRWEAAQKLGRPTVPVHVIGREKR